MSNPRPHLGLAQRAQQQMLLLPRMLQSIEVLQLPGLELSEYLAQAAQENDALRLEEPESVREPSSLAPRRRATTDLDDDLLQAQPDRAKSLAELVLEQIALADVEPELLPWVRFVAGCLDANGYLAASDETLIALARAQGLAQAEEESGERAALDNGRLGRAIAVVQRLEPRGIGGRNAVEALLLQLDPNDPDYALLCALLEDFLEDVARNRLPAVARALGVDLARLHELLAELRSLKLRPAAELVSEESPRIRPEVVAERIGPDHKNQYRFEVRVDSSGLPAVSIDPEIVRVARDRTQPREVRTYLRSKLEGARWIVAALEQRQRTLLRIASALFERQRAFLEHGPGHLAPLTMGEIADELEVAVSTISRAVAGKHAQTPWGIFALRHFFQAQSGSEDGARDDVREVVRRLFDAEDPACPYSDDEAVAELARGGFHLARRTVAKLRSELGIASSYRRRKYA